MKSISIVFSLLIAYLTSYLTTERVSGQLCESNATNCTKCLETPGCFYCSPSGCTSSSLGCVNNNGTLTSCDGTELILLILFQDNHSPDLITMLHVNRLMDHCVLHLYFTMVPNRSTTHPFSIRQRHVQSERHESRSACITKLCWITWHTR